MSVTDNTRATLDLGFHGYTPNTWGFLAVVWDVPNGVIYGYNSWTNQWPSTSVDTTKTPRNIVNAVYIGQSEGRNWFKGYIYEVLIYDRALTKDEVLHNYNNPDNPVRDGLIVWLKADPAYIQGSTWLDLSGNGNNATLYNVQLVQLVTPSPSPTISPISPSPTISPTLSIASTPTSPAPSAPKPSPWLWVGIGIAAVVALGAGLYVAHKKGLI